MAAQEKTVNINLRVAAADKRKFQRKCKTDGVVQSDVLRRLMASYAAGKIPTHKLWS
jgi:hypothetical protein